ncbi:MAG: hypothetical protein APF84_08795 [Gracilibacter sp. BRH_c7a]|nr:MAG: hypothetical protein APF84_08795 [Gracilibacter sp. BRH_c7a]
MMNLPEHVVFMEKVQSVEHIVHQGKEPQRVLKEISLLIRRGQVWGFNGSSRLEVKLLLEIIANIRPYNSGRCVLIERGMPQHKRIILNHVFYIGSSEMMYNNMNVLEFLMFVTAKSKINKVELQEQIFEFLIDSGLGHISLTSNNLLTQEEKAVILLTAAAYSNSLIIVFNLPEYEFDEILVPAIAKIAAWISQKGKTIILGTTDCLLIEKACSHTGILFNGKIIYADTVEDFRQKFDKVEVIVSDKNIIAMMDILAILLPDHKLSIKNNRLMISRSGSAESDPGMIYQMITSFGWIPERLEVNPKTVQNAYEELIQQHDL